MYSFHVKAVFGFFCSLKLTDITPKPENKVEQNVSLYDKPNAIMFVQMQKVYCTARQCLPLRRKFMECYIIKPAQSLLMKHLVIG